MSTPDSYGAYAAGLRTARGLSQQKLAELTGHSIATVQKVEAERGVKPETLEKLYRKGLELTADEWEKLLVRWLSAQVETPPRERSFTQALGAQRVREESARERLGARLERVLGEFDEEELSDYIRFTELVGRDRLFFTQIRHWLGIHPKAPPPGNGEGGAKASRRVRSAARKG